MLQIRRAQERGHANHGWLDTYHTFSFGDYYDPNQMGFRALRVMNDDRVLPGQGFGMHGHRNMEIVTYVLEGSLEHKDSLGTGSIIHPGELQRMTAGTGVRHSEYNPSKADSVHLYQIWLLPEREGLTPSYEQRQFPESEKQGQWRLVASPDGRDGSLTIRQDACIFLATLEPGADLLHEVPQGRHAWLQVLRGAVQLNGQGLTAGDGVAVSGEPRLALQASEQSEMMLFDLA